MIEHAAAARGRPAFDVVIADERRQPGSIARGIMKLHLEHQGLPQELSLADQQEFLARRGRD